MGKNILECNCEWHFAEQQVASQDIGPNNAAAEHFSATPYPSLIRESIQNSLDVVVDNTQPVRMKFEFGKLRANTFDAFYDLKNHIEGVLRLYGSKAEKEYRPMLNHFNNVINGQKVIYYMKVSDYNTTGMDYKDNDTDSPLYAFIRAEGVTVKQEEYSGGSYGFGKAAYFMMSPIRTVLVSTMTTEGKTFFEGAARLCTHLYFDDEKKKEIKYQHYGYYDNQDGKRPASLQTDIPNKFSRDEPGTDIYIMGVDGSDDKQQEAYMEMIDATLRHFWLAILRNKLVVEIGDTLIDSSTIDSLMEEHYQTLIDKSKNEDNYNPRPYYEAVKNAGLSKNVVKIEKTLKLLGNVCLYLIKNKDARDGVIHMRKQLMFIFRNRYYSSSYGYYAVFLCEDTRGNKLLKSIEDPSHRKWEAKRNPRYGREVKEEIDSFLNQCLEEVFVNNGGGPLNITGLEEYLFVPEELVGSDKDEIEDNPFFGEPSGNIQDEGTSPISTIENLEPIRPTKTKESIGKVVSLSSMGGVRQSGGKLGGHQRGEGKKKKKGAGNSPDRTAFTPDDNEKTGEFLENIPVYYRVFAETKNGVMVHSIIIRSDYDVERGQIELIVSGVDRDEKINIKSSSQGTPIGNIINNIKLLSNSRNIIDVQFEDDMKHAIQLTAYEFK